MKNLLWLSLILAGPMSSVMASGKQTNFPTELAPTPSPTDVMAKVNGKDITYQEMMDQVEQMLRGQPGARANREQKMQVLEMLVNRHLLEEKAKMSKMTVKDSEVKEQIDAIKGQFPDEATFQKALAAQGLTAEDLIRDITTNIRNQNFLKKDMKTEPVTEKEVSDFFQANIERFKKPEKVRASHILLKVDEGEKKDEVKNKLLAIRKKAVEGGDFALLAKEHSEGPSGIRGGGLGTFGRGKMVPNFDKVAFSTNVGTVSDIVETQFGFHIIKVFEHQEPQTLSLKEVGDNIKKHLDQQKKRESAGVYFEKLRKSAKIEIFL